MKIWTITNQKGGAGKTVLATNLAVEAGRQREKVLLIDLDPQESATKWYEARDAKTPVLIKGSYDLLLNNLTLAQEKGFTLVIIDTAGRESLQHSEVVEQASFCLVPCQPSKDDIRSAIPTFELIKNKVKPFASIITRCPTSGGDFEEARNTLSTIGLVCSTGTMERKCYKRAYAQDLAVCEYDLKDKGAGEITAIYNWVISKEDKLSNTLTA